MESWLKYTDEDKRRLIFGSESASDPAKAYDKKRTVHAGIRGKGVEAEKTMSVWQGEMNAKPSFEDACVYINIPFCQTKCTYCGFFKNLSDAALIDDYTESLTGEIRSAKGSPLYSHGRVRAVYIGGGTPGTLSARQIESVLRAVNESLPLSNDCEITFETRTYQFGDDKIKACADNGVNRFSLGVQSFDTKARRAIGRVDSGEKVMEMVQKLICLKEASVSLDFIFGLPHQSVETFLSDIQTADCLGVDGMALYQLNVFEGGKMDEGIKSGRTEAVPETARQYEYHSAAHEMLTDMGYSQLSMSHWVNGTLDRSIYNRFTKSGCILHAFGAGAGGRTENYGYFIHPAVTPYNMMRAKGIKPVIGLSEKSPMSCLYEFINGQMDTGILRFDTAERLFGIDLKTVFRPLTDSWEKRGLASVGEKTMKLLPAGQFWYVNMTQALLDILEMINSRGAYEPPVDKIAAQG
ncbi:heme anaerobic degradation radical SAM methyltransferase ChuW/HutW [Geovibrio thiophilus]|uniref:Heme anaerobic degradation radical SAM methyltransferase ChuW/HutW n=1 Tax=Geovibrio thiophilus TaxID=139438 RepID=A0A410JZB8_9BACT|nr:heme anaerobic degradation radical SAM methyltransferase ChuW/HutW [Geovibrio thiophilus]QAR33425.1 heme anaerobic degradation radical SAM methyltransferase ChuW/HutW [Geovibrio thiophilus]